MAKRWEERGADPQLAAAISSRIGVSREIGVLLAGRGVLPDNAAAYLNPSLDDLTSPSVLKGVKEAVELLVATISRGEKVCIHGDYDVDGVTATAILVSFFRAIASPVTYVIPLRLEDGYGLSTDGVDEAIRQGATALITVDCGITSVVEAEYCRNQGLRLIITDHHTPPAILPDADAIINPLQPGCDSEFKAYAGVGLAFLLAAALRTRLRESGYFNKHSEPNLGSYLDLVALGSIADMVPLTGDNRIYVAFGLKGLTATRREGVVALKKVAAITGEVSSGDVGFKLAPRLNAAGRLDDAKRGVELLLSTNPDSALMLAEELDAANLERRQIESEILAEALQRLESDKSFAGKRVVVMASESWHPGVIGIVSSRVVERHYKPTVLIALTDGVGKGSGRSIPAFNLYEGIASASSHLIKFGGHRQAAGLAVLEENIPAFYEDFNDYAMSSLRDEDLVPCLKYDCEIRPENITREFIASLEQMKPFGMGNPEPVFMLRGVEVKQSRVLKEKHLKLSLKADGCIFDAVAFQMAAKAPLERNVDILFTPEMNVWNGNSSIQLKIKDIRGGGNGEG